MFSFYVKCYGSLDKGSFPTFGRKGRTGFEEANNTSKMSYQ